MPGVSEMCYSCSELRLIMYFPIEILSLTLSLFNSGKQGALPRTWDSGVYVLLSPSWCLGRSKTGSTNWTGTLSLDQDLCVPQSTFPTFWGLLKTLLLLHIVGSTRCPEELQNSHLQGSSQGALAFPGSQGSPANV